METSQHMISGEGEANPRQTPKRPKSSIARRPGWPHYPILFYFFHALLRWSRVFFFPPQLMGGPLRITMSVLVPYTISKSASFLQCLQRFDLGAICTFRRYIAPCRFAICVGGVGNLRHFPVALW